MEVSGFLALAWLYKILMTLASYYGVGTIVIVHFDICILPKYMFHGSWEKWGEEASGRGGDEPYFDSRFGG